MAHERLSPRQKMIGMMYLILTAMLALNVSKEAVKAFMKVEQGLTKTVRNYAAKNSVIYAAFDAKAAENPVRGGPARDKANEIKQNADQLFDYVQSLKIEIIKQADGEKAKAINGNDIDIYAVQRFDDTNVPSQVLIGAGEDGKAFKLRAAINAYRQLLIEKLDGKNPTIEEALKTSLNTDDGLKEGNTGTPEAWPNNTFQTLPLVAVVAMLSKIQVDIRNAETDVITYLYDQIEAASFKFNKLIPIIQANSTYVMEGLEYEAKVFFSAVDTTQAPTVTVGAYEQSGTNPDGTPKYVMKGNYQTLKLDESGKGVYKVPAGAPGPRTWTGLITMNAPNGTVLSKPFKGEYTVGAQSVNVSPSAMNVLYRGIQNPIDVSVPGVPPDKIKVAMRNGKLSTGKLKNYKGETFPGDYIAEPNADAPNAEIIVSADISGKQQTFPPRLFRVKDVPTPDAQFAGKTGQGRVSLGDILIQTGVAAVLKDFDFELRYYVTEFSVSYDDRGLAVGASSKSNRITDEQKAILKRLTRGKKLYIQDIKATIGPGKKVYDLNPIIITVD
jgi:gliding motility-associated protein GldM